MATSNPTNEIGKVYGRWTVVAFSHRGLRGVAWWNCRCECGNIVTVRQNSLHQGNSKSCGCDPPMRTHGLSKSVEFRIWGGIIARCTNPNSKDFPRYGGRGIEICERWRKFENFLSDIGRRPTPLHSIDRYPDNNGNYEPGNVRWATSKEQGRNKRNTIMIAIDGVTRSLAEWVEVKSLNYYTIWSRIYKSGMSAQEAINNPILSAHEVAVKCGYARSQSLSPERRSEISRHAQRIQMERRKVIRDCRDI